MTASSGVSEGFLGRKAGKTDLWTSLCHPIPSISEIEGGVVTTKCQSLFVKHNFTVSPAVLIVPNFPTSR